MEQGKVAISVSTSRRKIASQLCCSVSSSHGRILPFPAAYVEPLLQCADTLVGRDFICALEPDMPKAVRIAAIAPSTATSKKSESNDLVSIALFCGIGLLVSLVAILMGVQGGWY